MGVLRMLRARHSFFRRVLSAASTALTVAIWSVPAAPVAAAVVPRPMVSDYTLVGTGLTPPAETHCFLIGRRCFAPAAFQNAYNLPAVYGTGNQGQGVTIAVVDSFG